MEKTLEKCKITFMTSQWRTQGWLSALGQRWLRRSQATSKINIEWEDLWMRGWSAWSVRNKQLWPRVIVSPALDGQKSEAGWIDLKSETICEKGKGLSVQTASHDSVTLEGARKYCVIFIDMMPVIRLDWSEILFSCQSAVLVPTDIIVWKLFQSWKTINSNI